MRLQNARVYASLSLAGLLAVAATGIGCAAKPIDTTYPKGPTVTAVYALDLNNGIPDVQIWSSSEPTRTSPMPPSYGAFRIEFDQTIQGSTVANMNDLSAASYCSKFTGGAITLHDPNDSDRELEWSLCYGSETPFGSGPYVIGILGAGVGLNSTPESPFTCQDFSADDGSGDPNEGGLILKPAQTYTIKFKSSITGMTGAAFVAPTDTSLDWAKWGSGNLTLKTAGFALMGVGYQNYNSGYYAWLKKPYAGFFKNMDEGKLYPGLEAFTMSPEGVPLEIYTTYGIAEGTITLTRGDDSEVPTAQGTGAANQYLVFPAMGYVNALAGWEPGQTYKIKIGADLKSTDGVLIDAAKEYTFTVGPDDPRFVASSLSNGAVAQPMYSAGASVLYHLTSNTPLEPSSVSTTTVTMKSAAGVDVPLVVSLRSGVNNQRIHAKPVGILDAATTYKLTVSGVKTQASLPNGLGNKDVTPRSLTFTTAAFHVDTLAGDRTQTVSPTVLGSFGGLGFSYTRPAASLTGDQFTVAELKADGTVGAQLPSTDFTFTKGGTPAGISWVLKDTNTAYAAKCGQAYEFKSLPSIASADATPLQLSAEGCTDAAGCADVRSFRTAVFAPGSIGFTQGTAAGEDKLSVTFNLPLDSVSANAALAANAFKLFPVNADGSLGAALALTCPALTTETATKLSCTADAALEANKHYLASFIVTNSTIIKSAASVVLVRDPNEHPVVTKTVVLDQTTCNFYGSKTRAILTACP